MKNETYGKQNRQKEGLLMNSMDKLSASPSTFEVLVMHYRELQKVMVSIEKTLLSYEVESQEEREIKEMIASEIWNRDYIVFRTRNVAALSVLTKFTVDQHYNKERGDGHG